jgi:glycosyltransferase involved in cell wall biosynthesis
MHSLILTVHNKEFLLQRVLDGIKQNTTGPYELIVIIDGCSDNSSQIIYDNFNKFDKMRIFETPDVFETKANNVGLKNSTGEYCTIIQDDMIINEYAWNERMVKPFSFGDVFAVTARTAHNWQFNPHSVHLNLKEDLDNCWCDIINHIEHARRSNTARDKFAIRSSVNRGPLMIDHNDLQTLNYLDESFAPLDMDEHDFCYRAKHQLNKLCGCYWIDVISHESWGGTRISGSPAPWHLKSHHKNTKIFYNRHKDLIHLPQINTERTI